MSGLEDAMKTCWVVDLGTEEYDKALNLQKKLVDAKTNNETFPDVLLLLEHPPSITFGVHGRDHMLRLPRVVLDRKGITIYKNDPDLLRGGKVTYHGPGQIVGYPIFAITSEEYRSFVNKLEQTMAETAVTYGISDAHVKSEKDKDGEHLRGTWCMFQGENRKLASRAIGQKYSDVTGKHITFHGFAFNVNTNLSHFDCIDSCGMKNEKMTSLQQVLGKEINIGEIKETIKKTFGTVFGYEMKSATPEALRELLKLKQ